MNEREFSYKALLPVPDVQDLALHRANCDPQLGTERLGQLVPLLKFIGFRIEELSPYRTVLTAPLSEAAMNQNGTHQAAIFYLLADYTLGVGMFAVLPGCYVVGVHDRCNALPLQFWLKSGRVEHCAPGTGSIRSEVCINAEKADAMRRQLLSTGRCELTEAVRIYQGDLLVAEAEHSMRLYVDLPRAVGSRVSTMQLQRLKASALMIAGLRKDPISVALAGDRGVAIAQRMTRETPQLPALVAARTLHIERYLSGDGTAHAQVLVLGVGLDSKPVKFARESQRWFLCDLPDMLEHRRSSLAGIGRCDEHSVMVPLDLGLSAWPEKVIAAGFDPSISTLVVLEGVSMYLTSVELRRTLDRIRELCNHRSSRLWLDHATHDIFSMKVPEVRSFLSSMTQLGEPFVTGFADAASFAGGDKWALSDNRAASDVLELDDPVLQQYRFALLETAGNR